MSHHKKIDLSDIVGAEPNRIRWLVCSGCSTEEQARDMAATFIEDITKLTPRLEKLGKKAKQ